MRSGQNCLQYCLVIFISPAASIAVYSFNISQAFAPHLCQYAKGVSEVELLSLPTHHCCHLVENGVGLQESIQEITPIDAGSHSFLLGPSQWKGVSIFGTLVI